MENKQAEHLTVDPETSKIPAFELLALIVSLVSSFVFFLTRPLAVHLYPVFVPPSLLVTTSVAFALSVTVLIRPLFSRPVKWRSEGFVISLIATILSALVSIPLLIEALVIIRNY
jgi:hypothetical protein